MRQLQLAIGVVRAGIDVSCDEAGLRTADLGMVLVAESSGQFVRKSSMLRLGTLPAVPGERVGLVGNAAGQDALLALVDRRVRVQAERLAARARYVERAGRPDHAEALTRNLCFAAHAGAP